ncbi:hypothetical protein BDV10DRAFT_153846 [Aspergillus recurvatus]
MGPFLNLFYPPPHLPRLVSIHPPASDNGCSSTTCGSKGPRQLPRASPRSGAEWRNAVSEAYLNAYCHAASGF